MKDHDKLRELVKQTISEDLDPVANQKLWQSEDLDQVTHQYQDFLAGMAQSGLLLDHHVFVEVLRQHFEGSATFLAVFAKVMAKCLTYCKRKKKTYPVAPRQTVECSGWQRLGRRMMAARG